jgi:hypothetical protein
MHKVVAEMIGVVRSGYHLICIWYERFNARNSLWQEKSAKSLNLALVRPGMAKKINWQVELVEDRVAVAAECPALEKVFCVALVSPCRGQP